MSLCMDYTAWRCKHDIKKFCPDEGCPQRFGCVRNHGWKPGDPNPAYPVTTDTEKSE